MDRNDKIIVLNAVISEGRLVTKNLGVKMNKWVNFECHKCHEPFKYSPPRLTQERIREKELETGKPAMVAVECPHCPAIICLDLNAGKTSDIDSSEAQSIGVVVFDMTLTENIKDKIEDLNIKGDELLHEGNISKAKKHFEKAISLRKHDPISWYNLGVCEFASGEIQRAEEAFRHSTKYNEKLVQAWNNLGMLLLQQGRLAEASDCFDSGIAADPSLPKCYFGKGQVFRVQGDKSQARKYYELALEKDPNYKNAKQALQQL